MMQASSSHASGDATPMPVSRAESPACASGAPVLQTRRLRIRPLQAGDRDLYLRVYCDEQVMQHIGAPMTLAAADRAFDVVLRQQSQTPARAWYWVLVPRDEDDGEDAGAGDRGSEIGIMALVFDAGGAAAELGLLLMPQVQGQGHASEAIAALLSWMQQGGAGPARLWTRHLPANPAAFGLMQRLRFLPDGERAGYLHWSMDRTRWATVGGRMGRLVDSLVDGEAAA